MNFKSLLVAGMTFAALTLSMGQVFAQDASSSQPAAAPADASSQAAAPAAGGDQAAANPQQNWLKICDPEKDGKRACIMRQVVVTQNKQFMGSFLLRIDSAKGVPTLAVAAVPVGVVLKPGLRWQIDTAKPQALPYWRCTAQSCESEQFIKADFISRLRKGKTLKLIAKDVANKDLSVSFSLAGFSEAYDLKDAPTFEAYAKSLPH